MPSAGLRLVGLEVTALRMTEGPRRLSHRPGATLLSGAHEVFVALETERLCKFVSLVMFVPGEHYISGALQAQSSSAYSSSTDEG